MFKTLLAGTLLSTGLLAGGGVGAEDIKLDQKVENSKYSDAFEKPEHAKSVERTEGTGSQQGKNLPIKEGTESNPVFETENLEKPEGAKFVERTEGTGSQQGKMVPAKEGN
ncbi:hypothetical protein [Bacillus sp. NPDC094077]|uniref:hypothetical protein n=1 Tax=Bacillus sp. NPDC094077 TaxID=3390932 RepID=UPI003CFBF4EC